MEQGGTAALHSTCQTLTGTSWWLTALRLDYIQERSRGVSGREGRDFEQDGGGRKRGRKNKR